MKTLDQVVAELEGQLLGTRKLLTEIRTERLKKEEAAKLAGNSGNKQAEPA